MSLSTVVINGRDQQEILLSILGIVCIYQAKYSCLCYNYYIHTYVHTYIHTYIYIKYIIYIYTHIYNYIHIYTYI